MSRCEIYLEDADDVGAHVNFRFIDGFNKTSAAHQMAGVIKGILDDLAADGKLGVIDEHMTAAEPDRQIALLSD